MPDSRFARELRFLRIHAVLSSLLMVILLAGAFRPSQNQRFTVIEVERINVVEPGGRLAMVISSAERLPGPILEGQELPAEMSAGRRGSAGMLFFNARGDEVGGLTFRGQETNGTYAAGGIIAFDQFKQDQVVTVQYSDRGTSRSAGVTVWDRSTTVSIHELVSLIQASRQGAEPGRAEATQRLQQLQQSGTLGAQRIFLGSQDRMAALRINDTQGRPRIRMYVDSANAARLEFLNERGEVVESWPGRQ
ncbi:MAG: hypothetical protein L0271_12895 [Gemmatimonadetes bacterium]|nr:hypothetical protein [Gemmatimonadota bacterium]